MKRSLSLEIPPNALAAAFVNTHVQWKKKRHIIQRVACRLCEDAPCVAACPRDALEQSQEKGIIIVDEEKCNGCGWCIEACDYGAIQLHPETRVVFTCDLCDGEPKCVEWCPEEALDFTTKDILSQKARVAIVKKLFMEALKAPT